MKRLEAEGDPAAVLVRRKKIEMGRSGPWKRVAEYRRFGEIVAKRIKHVREACGEAHRLMTKLEVFRAEEA